MSGVERQLIARGFRIYVLPDPSLRPLLHVFLQRDGHGLTTSIDTMTPTWIRGTRQQILDKVMLRLADRWEQMFSPGEQ